MAFKGGFLTPQGVEQGRLYLTEGERENSLSKDGLENASVTETSVHEATARGVSGAHPPSHFYEVDGLLNNDGTFVQICCIVTTIGEPIGRLPLYK